MTEAHKPYAVRSGVVKLLMNYIHTTPWITIREIVANAYDQYQKKGLGNKEPLVVIELSKSRKYFAVTDFATGIEDKDEFCYIGNENIEGLGKTVGDKISSSTSIDPNILGQFHVAKMTYPNLSEVQKVRIYSNNGKEGYKLEMLPTEWGDEQRYPEDVKEAALKHIGLKVEIVQAKAEILKPSEISKRLGEWFGLLISRRKLKIVIKDLDDGSELLVRKPDWLKTDNETLDPLLRMQSGSQITQRLEPTIKEQKDKNIYVFVKYVGITKIYMPFLVTGWVNCNGLTNYIDMSRDRLIESSFVTEFLDKLEKYLLAEGYERRVQESERMRCPKKVGDLANLAQLVSNKIFPDLHVELTGDSLKDQPESPATNGDLKNTPTEVEKRNPSDVVDHEKRKPNESNESKGGTRKPKKKHIINRPGGDNENRPDVQVIDDYFGREPTVSYVSAEELHINKDRSAAKIILKAGDKLVAKVAIPQFALAATKFRMRDMNPTVETLMEKYEEVLNMMWDEAAQ